MSLLDRHLSFLEALRGAGLPVSLAEDLDAVAALTAVTWGDRALVREAYAATLVKRRSQRATFDTLFDLWFPPLVGEGHRAGSGPGDAEATGAAGEDAGGEDAAGSGQGHVRDGAAALEALRDRVVEALGAGSDEQAAALATGLAREAVGTFGSLPGAGRGMTGWSAYAALQRVAPERLVERLVAALLSDAEPEPGGEERARRTAARRLGTFTAAAEAEARRRTAEAKGAAHVARTTVRPTIDQLDFLSARRADLEELRREVHPLARRLATRLTQEHHAQRRGPLDFRRTVRASLATGGVPLETRHRPRRPHRTDLVVLCDVSGSVANFAQFTLLLVLALRDQFQNLRAFTFIDHVHEVTHHLRPQADPAEVMADLAASASYAALWGRTSYGRAFTRFAEEHADALGPRSSLLILGDARSNHGDLALGALREMAGSARHAWWLNPEHRRHWDTGDSAASAYGEVVDMVECRNLTQLSDFVHDLL
ncbi:VWA domain-containing protein [Nocardioides sp. zg-DK7169]|uniref:VWA domain-containing protein n=1 Tax=Nocardioides sp. zg-DK7169 TaxID=2736600 RepID=UPI001555918F|nr:VWA domain-containing protein [Nocardioides sp. zg-DK7169]NPC98193.1 VWA domain-containing protein [Nocardioides sp. zg-DK7169]